MKPRAYKPRRSLEAKGRAAAGVATVEMAFLTPLLLLMVLGICDFGRVYYTAITLAHAARAGAAYGSQSNASASDIAGMEQAAREEAQDLDGISVTAERFCECPDAGTVDCVTGICVAGVAPELYVKVTASKTFKTLVSYPGIPDTLQMSRVAIVRAQ